MKNHDSFIDSESPELPYSNFEFISAWQVYEKFLLSNFQIKLTYMQKVHAFSMLNIESEGNVNKAIAMLKWNMRQDDVSLNFPDGEYDEETNEYF